MSFYDVLGLFVQGATIAFCALPERRTRFGEQRLNLQREKFKL
jgi:hypothetical protein